MSASAPLLPIYELTLKVTEDDPELVGCFQKYWVWVIPLHRLAAFSPGSREPIRFGSHEAMYRLMEEAPGCTPYPVLTCTDLPDVVFFVLRWRIWKPPEGFYGERGWTPDGQEEVIMRVTNHGRRGKQQTDQIWRWWERSRLPSQGGRPPYLRAVEEWRALMIPLIEGLDRPPKHPVTKARLAPYLRQYLPDQSARDWLRDDESIEKWIYRQSKRFGCTLEDLTDEVRSRRRTCG